jgi:hypothetical protein
MDSVKIRKIRSPAVAHGLLRGPVAIALLCLLPWAARAQTIDGFDYPVGTTGSVTAASDGDGYYNAQDFAASSSVGSGHCGEDWNGEGGGNSDLGDAVYAVADGWVIAASDAGCGWGKVVRVEHELTCADTPSYDYMVSMYAHLDLITVATGEWLWRGDSVGTIGTGYSPGCSSWTAHLHFELRWDENLGAGAGYGCYSDSSGRTDPSDFIDTHRTWSCAPEDPDDDGDGFAASVDCNDADAGVYPGASEFCNEIDDDCDGSVDEDDAVDVSEWFPDADGDGYPGADGSYLACSAPTGYLAPGATWDCDDARDDTYPGATEVAGDGIDQDCDGEDLPLGGDDDDTADGDDDVASDDDDDSDTAQRSWRSRDQLGCSGCSSAGTSPPAGLCGALLFLFLAIRRLRPRGRLSG